MNSQFDGKVALAAGGSSGIGLATSKLFAQRGAIVYITGRREKEFDEAVREIGQSAAGIQGDVSRLGDIDNVFQTIASRKANSTSSSPTPASANSLHWDRLRRNTSISSSTSTLRAHSSQFRAPCL